MLPAFPSFSFGHAVGPAPVVRDPLGIVGTIVPSGATPVTTTAKDPLPKPRSTSAGRISTNDKKPAPAAATINFGFLSGVTTTDVVVLSIAAVVAFYLWKKL